MSGFRLDDYISEDSRYGVNVREALQNKFARWLWGKTRQLSERVFAVTGPFGIGKTWFLRYIEASAASDTRLSSALPRNYTAMYVDWREAFDKGTTPRTFISQTKQSIEATPQPLCLCVDNIPGRNGASEDLNAFEEVLFRALSDGAFLLLAQEHPQYRGWSQKIPAIGTEPYVLGEFTPDAVVALGGIQSFHERSLGHPYLTRLLIDHSDDLEAYTKLVNAWLKDRGLFNKQEQILQIAYPLSLISSNAPDWPQKKNALWRKAAGGSIPREWESLFKLEIIENLQWLMIREHEGKILSHPRWYPPIQKCLQVCFRHKQPGLYEELQRTLQGGAA